MRRRLPYCPFCRMPNGNVSRMRPQVDKDGWITYVCENPNCRAVSPRERTYNRALNRAKQRSEPVIDWFDRGYEPTREDDYLCEYAFVRTDGGEKSYTKTHYGVWRWNPNAHRFGCEGDPPRGFAHEMKVLRWTDFKGETEKTEVAI